VVASPRSSPDEVASARNTVRRTFASLRAVLKLAWMASPRLAVIVGIAPVVFATATPLRISILQRLLRELPNEHARASLIASVAIFGLALGLGGVSQLVQREKGRLLGDLVARVAADRVLDVAQDADLVLFDDAEFHDRLRRAQQSQYRCGQAFTTLLAGLGGVLSSVGIVVVLASVNWLLMPAAIVAALPIALVSRLNSDDEYQFMHELAPAERQRLYLETLLIDRQPAKEIRAFNLAPFLRSLHHRLQDERINGLRRLNRNRTRRLILGSLLASTASAAIAGGLLALYFEGRMSVATAGAAIYGFAMLASQLRGVSTNASSLYDSLLYVAELTEFEREAVASESEGERIEGRVAAASTFQGVTMRDVAFTYPTASRPAVRGISLRVGPGEVIALVGPNGSGKTTVAKLLASLYTPESGQILWSGVDTTAVEPQSLRDQVAVGFQDFERFRMSASDNIGVGRHEQRHHRSEVVAASERAGANIFLGSLPDGLDTNLGPEFAGGQELSQGQWARVALARTFFRGAQLLILDEPTAALDPIAEFDLFETIRRGLANRSVVLISHRLASARTADRIYVFDQGQIAEAGTHDELVALEGLYAQMFDLQARAFVSSVNREPVAMRQV
jgi:ABC-type multidrug transport system fused ATPase/permease subunit